MLPPRAFHALSMTSRVPTVEDLRVKLCYICLQEELYDERSDPPKPWTHPCKCTLVAHEACLLKWIQTSQGTSARAAVNSLKCPQCGAQYELESKHPVLLKFLATGNKALQQLGRLFTLFGIATFVGVVSSGVYIILTGYGAWALKKFIGKEMFDLLLTAEPANWPYAAYFNLPLMSISLVLSRLQNTSSSIPAIIPILLLWPPSSPVKVRQQLLQEYWTNPSNARRLAMSALPAPAIAWPPSPFAVGLFFLPLARNLYRILYAKLALWVLGAKAASLLPSTPIRLRRNNGANGRRNGNGGQGQQQEAGQGHQNQQGEGVQQVVWQWNIFPLMLRIRANVGEVIQQEGGNNNNNAPNDVNGNAQLEQAPDPNANNANADREEGNPNPNPGAAAAVVEAAEQQIEVNTTSLGRQIGGALLIPAISSWMGSILLRLSLHSRLLRDFLAIKHTVSGGAGRSWWNIGSWSNMMGSNAGDMPGGMLLFPSLPPPPLGQWSYSSWEGLSPWDQVKLALKLTLQSAWGGTRTWAESDPVWWRNSIGLGLFVVARDCLQLLHLWLTKRELETRRVKNRDFAGVDVNELDLIPSWSDRT